MLAMCCTAGAVPVVARGATSADGETSSAAVSVHAPQATHSRRLRVLHHRHHDRPQPTVLRQKSRTSLPVAICTCFHPGFIVRTHSCCDLRVSTANPPLQPSPPRSCHPETPCPRSACCLGSAFGASRRMPPRSRQVANDGGMADARWSWRRADCRALGSSAMQHRLPPSRASVQSSLDAGNSANVAVKQTDPHTLISPPWYCH